MYRRSGDAQIYRSQIERTYMVTLLGVFTVVLLWVWMVAPLLAPGVWPLLDLPSTSSGRKAPTMERDVFISVDARGTLYFNERPVSVSALRDHIRAAEHATVSTEPPRFFVRVDRGAPFRAVREVVVAARSADQAHLIFLARAPQSEMLRLYDQSSQ
jgi:biopolymer transport protein ExbD